MELIHTALLGQVNSAQYGWPVTTFPVFHCATRTWCFMGREAIIKYKIYYKTSFCEAYHNSTFNFFHPRIQTHNSNASVPAGFRFSSTRFCWSLALSPPTQPTGRGSSHRNQQFLQHFFHLPSSHSPLAELITQTSGWSEMISGHSTYEWCIIFSKLDTLQQIL